MMRSGPKAWICLLERWSISNEEESPLHKACLGLFGWFCFYTLVVSSVLATWSSSSIMESSRRW